MNKHELRGGARYVGGKVEKAIGDTVESRDWQVTGLVDQASGAAESLFGRAQSAIEDAADATPGLIEDAKARAGELRERAVETAKRTGDGAARAVRGGDPRLLWAALAAAGGYVAGWLIHGRRG